MRVALMQSSEPYLLSQYTFEVNFDRDVFKLDSSCGPPSSTWLDKTAIAYIGIAIMLFMSIYQR